MEQGFKLMEIKGTVIQRGWKAESIIHQYQFTAAISSIHTTYLGNRLVTFINHT